MKILAFLCKIFGHKYTYKRYHHTHTQYLVCKWCGQKVVIKW
mgnify:CR=1 FL=1